MFKQKIGTGKGRSYECPIGLRYTDSGIIPKAVLKIIAGKLAKRHKITNGQVVITELYYTYYKAKC